MAGGMDLVVNLAGNNARLKKSLTESKGSMTDFATSATTLLNPITVAFTTLAATAAAAGLSIYGIAQRMETLAGVADKAAQTGLTAEFIQQLGFAADQSGTSVDALLGGLEKMTISLGNASLHTEETAKAFEQIGLSASDIAALSPQDQFLAIADAIAKLPNVAEKAAATVAIFGKSAAEMAPFLAQGEKGIRALMEEAANLKIAISAEDLESIGKADDAIVRMKATLSAVVSNIAVGMAPLFESISNTITEITPKIAEIAKAVSTGLADAIGKAVTLFNSDLLPGLKEFLTVSGELLTKWSEMDGKFEFAGQLLKAVFDVAMEYIKVYWSIMLDDMIAATAKAAGDMLKMLDPRQGAAAVADWLLGQDADKIDPNNETAALDAAQGRLNALIERLQTGGPAIDATVTPVNVPSVPTMPVGGLYAMPPASAPGQAPIKQPGKDPNVDATQQQTRILVEALQAIRPIEYNAVPSF